jgi:hypothetical protein
MGAHRVDCYSHDALNDLTMKTRMNESVLLDRREFLAVTSLTSLGWLLLPGAGHAAEPSIPASNPVGHLKLPWTEQIQWANAVNITTAPGNDLTEKLAAAQAALAAKGGGVVFFPPGVYRFRESIHLLNGVVLRGSDPLPVTQAHEENYAPPSRLEFPKFEFTDIGNGTPLDSAFKGIYLQDPATASNCGVVNLDLNRGHIHFKEAEDHTCGRNRIVFGCVLRNAARPNLEVPDLAIGQKPWQRYTVGYKDAAIDVKANPNGLVANNRLPRSGDDNFTMNGYLMLDRARKPLTINGVVFDYDNRAGIYLNHYGIGGAGGSGPDGTPESHPFGFRKGLVIRDNFVFNTGRCSIGFCGDGVECRNNVIRFARDVWRPTVTGRHLSHGASTNDNRAVEMRGWRWVVDGNDYEVYRNIAFDRVYPINDGEGLMHEDHVNSTVKDSVLTNNRGNAYLSIYLTAGIDGLLVEGNEIRIDRGAGGEPAIHVSANRTSDPFPCRNVRILNNTVSGRGILINGSPAENNVIQGNRAVGVTPQKIKNQANARVEDNVGFEVDNTPWQPRRKT